VLGTNPGLVADFRRFASIRWSLDCFVSDFSIILKYKSVETVAPFATIGDCSDLRDPTSNASGAS
jgi:hypothetical protein